MKIDLEIPREIQKKLSSGDYDRVGGVVRNIHDGRIVALLKESQPRPEQILDISNYQPGFQFKSECLNSIFNLSPVFLIGSMITKINKIDKKLDILVEKINEVNARIKNLQWRVDFGFACVLQAISALEKNFNVEISSELQSASNLAWSCQFLVPNSNQRLIRIENAFHTATLAKNKLLILAESLLEKEIENAESTINNGDLYSITEETIQILLKTRQALAACVLWSFICTETEDLYSASTVITSDAERVKNLLNKLCFIYFGSDKRIYLSLMSEESREIISPSRIIDYAKRYNLNNAALNLDEIASQTKNEFIRAFVEKESKKSKYTPHKQLRLPYQDSIELLAHIIYSGQPKPEPPSEQTPIFFDLIDGINEDISRMLGYGIEYKEIINLGLSMTEYKNLFNLDEQENYTGIVTVSL